ncbi:MAG: LysM peptidoglycan-binding domain-containing protein [Paludibacteraceae bacterium]|nr:LysM peptidoglycan-binding domain-containing protein [Paludibacteraceae bacterium]
MATINGMYIFVENEDYSYNVEVTDHVVETGIEITDHVQAKATTLSITGEIVGENSETVKNKLKQLEHSGTICKFVGRNTLANCIITNFTPTYTVDIWGGCGFSMSLKEVRTASTSFTSTGKTQETKITGTQQVTQKSTATYVYHTVKKGDTIWALVAATNAPYKKYGMTCDQVMKLNPSAFSKPGDFRTLQIGKKIIVGKK